MIMGTQYTLPSVKFYTFPDTDFCFFQLVAGCFIYDKKINFHADSVTQISYFDGVN